LVERVGLDFFCSLGGAVLIAFADAATPSTGIVSTFSRAMVLRASDAHSWDTTLVAEFPKLAKCLI
jgi:hypothetical protein